MGSPEVGPPEVETPVAQGDEGVSESEIGEGIEPPRRKWSSRGWADQSCVCFLFSFFFHLFWRLGDRRLGNPTRIECVRSGTIFG